MFKQLGFVLVVGSLVIGCAHTTANIYEGSPDWVRRGSGAFGGDSGKAFYGVGSVSSVNNPGLRRNAVDASARAGIAKTMNTFTKQLDKIYAGSTVGGTMPSGSSEEQSVSSALKSFSEQRINGAEVIDHWIATDGTEFALARLDFNMFKDGAAKVADLNARAKEVIEQHAAAAFEELDRESEAQKSAPAK